jgi:signal transduction histidine kinase
VTDGRRSGADPQRGLSFRARLTVALIASAIVPLVAFVVVVLLLLVVFGTGAADNSVARSSFVFALTVIIAVAIVTSYLLASELTEPLRSIARSVDRVSSGDLSTPIRVAGDDELARLAESHNRLSADLDRRNRTDGSSPRSTRCRPRRCRSLVTNRRGGEDRAHRCHGRHGPQRQWTGRSSPVSAALRTCWAGGRFWRAHRPVARDAPMGARDQDLLEVCASEMGAAIRNAQLFATVQEQNAQLLELDAAKDDFLRGVSHNLQTPLTSIRAYAEQLDAAQPDRRLGIIAEQSERLSRMVRQLLTVTRLESGTLKPRSEVVALATRVRKAWEALGVDDIGFDVDDAAGGWLAVTDADQLDQVLWALLDNAVKYGGPPSRLIAADVPARRLRLTIADGGPPPRSTAASSLRPGRDSTPDGGVAWASACRASSAGRWAATSAWNGGGGAGAAFTIDLPGEPGEEG